jgi:hypothetical protein
MDLTLAKTTVTLNFTLPSKLHVHGLPLPDNAFTDPNFKVGEITRQALVMLGYDKVYPEPELWLVRQLNTAVNWELTTFSQLKEPLDMLDPPTGFNEESWLSKLSTKPKDIATHAHPIFSLGDILTTAPKPKYLHAVMILGEPRTSFSPLFPSKLPVSPG